MIAQRIVIALAATFAFAGSATADEPGTDAGTWTPAGQWLAEDIGGGGVLDRVQTTLVLGADGATSGRGGCNAFTGSHKLDGDKISFGPIASTMMACPPAVMDQERKFFDALETVTAWRALPEIQKLELLNSGGAAILTFSSVTQAE